MNRLLVIVPLWFISFMWGQKMALTTRLKAN